MKARLCIVASALLLAGPAVAQEPLDKTGTEPTTQMAPSGDSSGAMTPDPLDKTATEPSTNAPGAAMQQGTEPLAQTDADTQKQADAPAYVVISDLTEAEDDKKMVQPWNVPVDSVEEMDVYDANGKKIGEVDAVLQDKGGDIKGVAVGYGGFLGFGEKGAVVTLDQLKLKDGTLVTEMTEDQLSKQPEWKK